MTSAIYSTPSPAGELKISLALGAFFPFFLAASALQRLLRRASLDPQTPSRSVIGEARENMSIAKSYALMARAMLQSFARD